MMSETVNDKNNAEKADDSKNDDDSEENSWDIARVLPWEEVSPGEACLPCLQATKFIVYVILFLIILGCSVIVQGCLLLLTAALQKPVESAYRETVLKQLVWIICAPYLLVFIISILKAWFSNSAWPSCRLFLFISIVEMLHSFGITLFVFRVLAAFNSIYALGLLYAIGIIPSFIKLIFARRRSRKTKSEETSKAKIAKCVIVFVVDVACMLCQLGSIGVSVYLLTSRSRDNYSWAVKSNLNLPFQTQTSNLFWQLPIALVFISLKWWENFVDKNVGFAKLFRLKRNCQKTRIKANTITSLVNIGTVIVSVYLLEYIDGYGVSWSLIFGDPFVNASSSFPLLPIGVNISSTPFPIVFSLTELQWEIALGLTQLLAAAVVYFCSSLACRLLMQRISFCVAIYLSTPVLAIFVCLQCHGILPNLPMFGRFQYEMICSSTTRDSNFPLMITMAVLYWLSSLWLTNYVWFPKAERLASAERLFVQSLYSGPVVVQSLLFNRRRNDRELRLTSDDEYFFIKDNAYEVHDDRSVDDDQQTASTTLNENGDVKELTSYHNDPNNPIPMIYACATMWHEEEDEMKALFKSIYRLDQDQCARRIAQRVFNIQDPDYYEMEAHIFFDDAMELNDDDKWVVNKYVRNISNCLTEASSLTLKAEAEMQPPIRTPTPYGGRLTWTLPGGNKLIVHLKDKNKIRHRKRWSQVMYMYYLLGYRLFEEHQVTKPKQEASADSASNSESVAQMKKTKSTNSIHKKSPLKKAQETFGYFAKSEILNSMDEHIIAKAANTFVLALDGDVDFKPEAVRLLLDRMKRNPKTGAACGRIHPTGSGPMVWYQLFEYAIGHWFQKATEHVLGCVLCSPGCFSLFRGLALLDDNVMKMYTKKVEKASEYLQCDQGEDRWLCTLLLKQGYRVDYTAAADAYTHAPEGFDEFFNQRRRWLPSTMANSMDLLGDWQTTIRVNDNISYFYIIYQFLLMISTILGPATIILAIAQAYLTIFDCTVVMAYILSTAPAFIYIIICFYCKTETQLFVAKILCAFFACIMLFVLIGTIHMIVTAKHLDPGFVFTAILVGSFIFAGVLHPFEIFCLVHGVLYYLSVPAGYLVLVIYSLSNMNSVSWGTREVPIRKTLVQQKAEEEKRKVADANKQKKKGCCSFFNLQGLIAEIKDLVMQIAPPKTDATHKEEDDNLKTQKAILEQMKELTRHFKKKEGKEIDEDFEKGENNKRPVGANLTAFVFSATDNNPTSSKVFPNSPCPIEIKDDINNPHWISYSDGELGNGAIELLSTSEHKFWIKFIQKYLKPLEKGQQGEEDMKKKLLELRTSSCMAFWFVNLLWILISLLLVKDSRLNTVSFTIAGTTLTTQPFGFIFLLLFFLILLLQLISIVIHRWSTFLQLLSITEIKRPMWMKQNVLDSTKTTPTEARDLTKELMYRRLDDDPTVESQKINEIRRQFSTVDIKRAIQISQKLRGNSGQLKSSKSVLGRQQKNDDSVLYENMFVSRKGRKSAADFKRKRFAEGNEFERNFNQHVDNDMRISKKFEITSAV